MIGCLHHMDWVNRVCTKCGMSERDIIAANAPGEPTPPPPPKSPELQPDGYQLPLPGTDMKRQRYLLATATLGWKGKLRLIEAMSLYARHRGYMRHGMLHPDVKDAMDDAIKALEDEGGIYFEELC